METLLVGRHLEIQRRVCSFEKIRTRGESSGNGVRIGGPRCQVVRGLLVARYFSRMA
jgi:hypothetical protein